MHSHKRKKKIDSLNTFLTPYALNCNSSHRYIHIYRGRKTVELRMKVYEGD